MSQPSSVGKSGRDCRSIGTSTIGKALSSPQPLAGTQGAYDPFFSPDGRWFGYFVGDELKKMRVTGGPPQRLAPARRAVGASWSPNEVQGIYQGRLSRSDASEDRRVVAADSNVFFGSGHLAFVRRLRDRQIAVLRESAAGGNAETLTRVIGFPQDWSPDGRHVALEVTTPTQGSDLMLLDLSSKTLTPYLATPFMEREAQFSPDGQFMAYSSSESRQREVYVEPIPRDGRRWQVSNDYGKEPRWRGDGRELFYLGRQDQLTAVTVRPTTAGLAFGRPTPLFQLRIRGCGRPLPLRRVGGRSALPGEHRRRRRAGHAHQRVGGLVSGGD